MKGSIKVELGNDGNYVGISTYERSHGSKGRFLLSWHLVMDALTGGENRSLYDTDCGNFAELWREGEHLFIRFTWLSQYDRDRVQGFIQTVRLPKKLMIAMLEEKGRRKYLCQPIRRQARIDSLNASETIRRVLKSKLTKRAFSKAMRECFMWPGDEVKLYNDGIYNFYFTTKSGFPKCGGLILHEGGERTTHPYVYYSIHT